MFTGSYPSFYARDAFTLQALQKTVANFTVSAMTVIAVTGCEGNPTSQASETILEVKVTERPVVEAGLVDLVTGNHQLTKSLTAQAALGHTEGHQKVHLHSDNQHAFFSGDCYHHPIQLVEPSIEFGGGYDMQQVIRMRRKLVELSASPNTKLIAAHAR